MGNMVEKELKKLARREEELRRQAHREEPRWRAELKTKVPEKVYASLRTVFRKAFEIIFEKGTGIIERTLKRDELTKDYRMRDLSVGLESKKDYHWLNARSDLSGLTALLASAVYRWVLQSDLNAIYGDGSVLTASTGASAPIPG